MRTLFFLSTMAAVAAVGYLYVPKLFGDDFTPATAAPASPQLADLGPDAGRGSVESDAAGPRPAMDVTPVRKAPPPSPPSPPAASASHGGSGPGPSAGQAPKSGHTKKKKKKKKPPGQASAALGDEGLDGQADAEGHAARLAAATGLTPADGDAKTSRVRAAAAAGVPANGPENRLHDRWIEGLSGDKARLSMGKKLSDDSCAAEFSHCMRPPLSQDIELVGVVVKTNPMQPLQGKVVRGSYDDQTPAVYVK